MLHQRAGIGQKGKLKALASALFWKQPDSNELAFFGLTAADVAGDPVEVWPDNEKAFDLFCYMLTQWRIGMNGRTGLDYNVLFHKMDRMNLTPSEYDQLEADIQIMEYAALEEISRDK